ncbi:MAG: HEAT repeat domain-containing protein, partial [Bacteroidota bacterium]|nr:HEAT repeat domain-containing protein [Bacteroidota bacterium]
RCSAQSCLTEDDTGHALLQLLNDKDASVRISAVKAVSRLTIREASPSLLTLLKRDSKATVRVEALKALASMQSEHSSEAIQQALTDKDKTVRIAGIDLIGKLNIPKDLMVSLLSDVIKTKTPEEKQAALLTLGGLPVQHTGKIFDDLLQQLASGKLSSEIYLELADAIDSTRSPQLIAKYKQATASKPSNDPTVAYAGSLFGGDAERGKRIFFSHESAQCMRCHSYDDMGGNAGPRLNGVATRLTRPQILEALIAPSARLAPGFGVVTLDLKDGKTVSGILQQEDQKTLSVRGSGRQNIVVAKEQIAKRTNAASSMPDMKAILSKKEIRDVVSFLATLKE